jgi:magnesium-transporting ATPase (P-type)
MSGAIGGFNNKILRRILIPFTLAGLLYGKTQNLWSILVMLMSAPLSMGYGQPSPDDNKPSFLGKIFYKITKENKLWSNILTRGTIGVLITLSLFIIPVLRHNYITFGVCSLGIILVNATISWRDLGYFEYNKMKLLKVEAIVWGIISLLVAISIYF